MEPRTHPTDFPRRSKSLPTQLDQRGQGSSRYDLNGTVVHIYPTRGKGKRERKKKARGKKERNGEKFLKRERPFPKARLATPREKTWRVRQSHILHPSNHPSRPRALRCWSLLPGGLPRDCSSRWRSFSSRSSGRRTTPPERRVCYARSGSTCTNNQDVWSTK